METLFLTLILGVDHYLPLAAVLSKLDNFTHNRKILVYHLVIDGQTSALRPMTDTERQILEVHAKVAATKLSGGQYHIGPSDLLQITAEGQHEEQEVGKIFLGNWAKGERFVFSKTKWPVQVGRIALRRNGSILKDHQPYFAKARDVFPNAPWPETLTHS